MTSIIIDDKEYTVTPQKNLLETCLSLGLNLPYFCWHPAMGSVGACRQCGVKSYKDEKDTKGRIVMACMEPVREGMRIGVFEDEAKEFRAGVSEWLMANHPHDCPVCDEGGECHLQDMTVMNGHAYRRFNYKKRTHRNQYLGPFVNHEMNRCIHCYRCVRFYRGYAGGRDFNNFASRNHVYFGRHEDGVLQNEFSGNLVEVCPTGVFTDKTLKKQYTRKWDFTSAPSICTHCGLGCNVIAGERYGSLRRIRSRYNGAVNGYFICNRGRYGYEFINHEKRIKKILIRNTLGDLEETDKETLMMHAAQLFSARATVIGIGSPRASLESNFTLQKLVGKNNYFQGVSGREAELMNTILAILRKGPARSPALKDIEKADAVLVIGEDVTNTAPMLALALRQSVRQKPLEKIRAMNIPEWQDAAVREAMQQEKGPFYIASCNETNLDDIATKTFRGSPDDIARLGFEVAAHLSATAPRVRNQVSEIHALAEEIAAALKEAKRPLVVSGMSSLSKEMIHAAANVAWALCGSGKRAELSFIMPEANSLGTSMLGGKSLDDAFEAAGKGLVETVVILENNLYRRTGKDTVGKFLDTCKNVIVLDYLKNETTAKADVIVPVGTFTESDGTFVNNEGRAQRYYQVYLPSDPNLMESWRWMGEMIGRIKENGKPSMNNFADFTNALVDSYPEFEDIKEITPPPGFRIAGEKIPRQPHRYSGRTAMLANIHVSEPKPPEDPDSPLSFTMEGYRNEPPSSIIPFYWSPGWNSVQSINKYQIEVGGSLHGGDPGKRLIEPDPKSNYHYFTDIPEAFKFKDNEFLAVPVYHIYGSEELSNLAPGIASLMPKPYVAMNPGDAGKWKVKTGDEITLIMNDQSFHLLVEIKREIPKGILGIPVGLPGTPHQVLPSWCKISGNNT